MATVNLEPLWHYLCNIASQRVPPTSQSAKYHCPPVTLPPPPKLFPSFWRHLCSTLKRRRGEKQGLIERIVERQRERGVFFAGPGSKKAPFYWAMLSFVLPPGILTGCSASVAGNGQAPWAVASTFHLSQKLVKYSTLYRQKCTQSAEKDGRPNSTKKIVIL